MALRRSTTLFEPALPEGLRYFEGFLSEDEESSLLRHLADIELGPVTMHGVVARRRVAHFGMTYDYDARSHAPGGPIPAWLLSLRTRVAERTGRRPEEWEEILATEYPPGAPIGWHRDAPGFGVIAGVSLGSSCRLRFRRGKTGAWETRELRVEPRSLYVLEGAARNEWQHAIPAVSKLRYSITFRTMRSRPGS